MPLPMLLLQVRHHHCHHQLLCLPLLSLLLPVRHHHRSLLPLPQYVKLIMLWNPTKLFLSLLLQVEVLARPSRLHRLSAIALAICRCCPQVSGHVHSSVAHSHVRRACYCDTVTDTQQKVRLAGIIICGYTPQLGPPARMYLLVADEDGVAGVTVWGDTVRQITGTSDCIGRAVAIPGCTLSFYNGKRSLNVPRNAIVHFTATSPAQNWWEQKLDGPAVNTQQLLQMPDHTVANVLAICGSITRQEKTQCMQVTIISGMWLNDDLL